MIGLVLIVGGGIVYWAWQSRDARALRLGDVAAVVAALIGLRLFSRGELLPGIAAVGGAAWWYRFRRRGTGDAGIDMSPEQARRLLDLPPRASTMDIRAAHRRLVARVHPDAGGSADLAARVNAARDTLLANRRTR